MKLNKKLTLSLAKVNNLKILILLICIYLCISLAYAANDLEDSIGSDKGVSVVAEEMGIVDEDPLDDDLDKQDESRITTKIYRSDDPSLDLIDETSNIDPTIQSDVVDKDDLLMGGKIHGRKKNILHEDMNKQVSIGKRKMLFPWLIAFVLVVFLSVIFKYLIRK